MPVLPELLAANQRYAASFTKGDLPLPPGRQVAVLVCMDARIDPAKALGLEEATRTSSATRAGAPATTRSARWSFRTSCWAPKSGS
jgi:hypothetical protein